MTEWDCRPDGLRHWCKPWITERSAGTSTATSRPRRLLSTIDLVKKHGGWNNEKVDTKTMYTPFVVVPDAGVVNGLLTQFDINLRGLKVFERLQPQVYAPGIVPISDVQLLEGMADTGRKYGKNPDMMKLIANWRAKASKYGLASLQLYLLSSGFPLLPLSDHVVKNSRKVMELSMATKVTAVSETPLETMHD